MLALRLLGTPQITQDQQPIYDLPAAKSQALLFYLACRGRVQSRLSLSGLLWPEKSDTEARMNLRQALYQLRQILPGLLDTSRETIALSHEVELNVDALAFQQEITRGLAGHWDDLRAAADRYQGDFLSGFYLDDTPTFEEWMLVERERLRGLALQAFHQLAIYFTRQKDMGTGLIYAGQLLALEPLREESHQQMMRLLAGDGQIGAALAQYERCRQLLSKELGASPSAETTALYEAILTGRVTQSRPQAIIPTSPFPHNLPSQPTPFIGRERELTELAHLCHQEGARLITIIGSGGMGKTRFSLAFAEKCLELSATYYPDGVYFVALTNVNPTPEIAVSDQISLAINQALGLTPEGGGLSSGSPKQQLLDYLRPRHLLLVLDNFEHLQHGHLLLAELLQASPFIHIIVTSRERLSLYEERVFRLTGLALPQLDGMLPVGIAWRPDHSRQFDTLAQAEAVQLFMQAAQRVRHTFQPRPEEWPTLVRLCVLLNGMPLALELAAAWVDILNLADILAELEEDLSLLSTDLNNVAERHRSLSQVFEYTWQRLSQEEHTLLAALTVFRGGFTRSAAAAVTQRPLSPRLLSNLVHKSLITLDTTQERYEIHELLRRFTTQKMGGQTTQALVVVQGHCHHYCTLLQRRETELKGKGQEKALTELERDLENIRLAWQWAVIRREIGLIAAALNGLFILFDTRSRFLEGEKLFREAALRLAWDAQDPHEVVTLARLQARQGWFTFHLGQHKESIRLIQRSLTYLGEKGHSAEAAFCLNYLGAVLRHQGRYQEASEQLQQALHLAQSANDAYQASLSFNTLGQIAFLQGDLPSAHRHCQEGLRLKRIIGDRRGMIYSLTYLGRVAEAQSNFAEAQQLFRESLDISQAIGDHRGAAIAWQNLGNMSLASGQLAEAEVALGRGLAIYQSIGDRLGSSRCWLRLGELLTVQGDFAAAESHLRQGIELALAIGSEPVLVAGIVGLASVWLKTNQPAKAKVCLAYVAHLPHPYLVPSPQITRLQYELETHYPENVSAAAAPVTDLETFVQEWLLSPDPQD